MWTCRAFSHLVKIGMGWVRDGMSDWLWIQVGFSAKCTSSNEHFIQIEIWKSYIWLTTDFPTSHHIMNISPLQSYDQSNYMFWGKNYVKWSKWWSFNSATLSILLWLLLNEWNSAWKIFVTDHVVFCSYFQNPVSLKPSWGPTSTCKNYGARSNLMCCVLWCVFAHGSFVSFQPFTVHHVHWDLRKPGNLVTVPSKVKLEFCLWHWLENQNSTLYNMHTEKQTCDHIWTQQWGLTNMQV